MECVNLSLILQGTARVHYFSIFGIYKSIYSHGDISKYNYNQSEIGNRAPVQFRGVYYYLTGMVDT